VSDLEHNHDEDDEPQVVAYGIPAYSLKVYDFIGIALDGLATAVDGVGGGLSNLVYGLGHGISDPLRGFAREFLAAAAYSRIQDQEAREQARLERYAATWQAPSELEPSTTIVAPQNPEDES